MKFLKNIQQASLKVDEVAESLGCSTKTVCSLKFKKKNLRVDEVGDEMNISRSTVYRLIADGHLTAFRLRPNGDLRITRESLDKYISHRIMRYRLEKEIVSNDVK